LNILHLKNHQKKAGEAFSKKGKTNSNGTRYEFKLGPAEEASHMTKTRGDFFQRTV